MDTSEELTAQRAISAADPAEAERLLNAAEQELRTLSMRHRERGILVTRTGPGSYTAELSSRVPYGTTEEESV